MPLGLDGNSLAFAGKATKSISDAYNQGQIDALKLAEAMRAYETGGAKDLYVRERMPVEFAEANAKSAQNILPINWDRINQLSGTMGTQAVNSAIAAPPPAPPAISPQQMAPLDGSNIKIDPSGARQDYLEITGKSFKPMPGPPPQPRSEEDKYFEQALAKGQKRTPQGEEEEIGVDLGASRFKNIKQRELYLQSLKPEVQQIADLATRNKKTRAQVYDEGFLQGIGDQALSQLIVEADSEAEIAAVQKELNSRAGRSPQSVQEQMPPQAQPAQPMGLGTDSLMRLSGSVDPRTGYMSAQEKDIAEKAMGLEAQRLAAGLRAGTQIREGDANRQSQQAIENARISADIAKAQSKQELDALKAELDARYKQIQLGIQGNKPPPAPRGGSGRAQQNLELEERKRIDANLDQYKKIKAVTPVMIGRQKKEMFNTYLLPEYNSAQFPANKQMIYNLAPDMFKANGIEPGGSAPKTGVTIDKIKQIRTLKNNMAKVQSVPKALFDQALQKLKSQGISDGDIESLRSEFAGKVK